MKTILMVCWVGLMCLLFSSVVVAQTTSNIQGTVKDAKGAVVKGAEVKGAPSLFEFTAGGALTFNY